MEAGETPGRALEAARGEVAVSPAEHGPDGVASSCPFLLAADPADPGAGVDAECVVVDPPAALSARHHRYVCAGTLYPSCPRYLRATLPVEEADAGRPHARRAAEPVRRRIRSLPRSTLVSMLLVAVSIAASVVGVAAGVVPIGGAFSADAGASGMVAGRTAFASGSQPAAAVTIAVGSATPSARPTSRPAVSSPSAAPSPVRQSWPPGATESRMTLVTPCAGRAACYVYTVRRGDNLVSIANFFGVSRPRIDAMNPWLSRRTIQPGDALQIPPPSK